MPKRRLWQALAGVAVLAMIGPGGAIAQTCGNDGAGFDRWVGQYRAHAVSQGIRQTTVDQSLQAVSYDTSVIRLDRNQRSFKLTFDEFYKRRVSEALIKKGRQRMQQHSAVLANIEKKFGVPAPILMAIWGLETNFGGDVGGKYSIIQSLATLAYDCRRSDFFKEQLTYALRIVDRGDIPASQMRGGWAGEIGPMQFLPKSYDVYAVDFDGDGHRDLFHSIPDMLASTANFFKGHGWKTGQSWEEGTPNYNVIREWNKAEVYVKTIAIMAQRLSENRTPDPSGPAPSVKIKNRSSQAQQ